MKLVQPTPFSDIAPGTIGFEELEPLLESGITSALGGIAGSRGKPFYNILDPDARLAIPGTFPSLLVGSFGFTYRGFLKEDAQTQRLIHRRTAIDDIRLYESGPTEEGFLLQFFVPFGTTNARWVTTTRLPWDTEFIVDVDFDKSTLEATMVLNGEPETLDQTASPAGGILDDTSFELTFCNINTGNAPAVGAFMEGEARNYVRTVEQSQAAHAGSAVPFAYREATAIEATSGTLLLGKAYRISDFQAGDDFTNIGAASNANGVEFIATGTTPTTWTNSSGITSIGTLVSLVPENFGPSFIFDPDHPTIFITVALASIENVPFGHTAFYKLNDITNDTGALPVAPPGWELVWIDALETAGNAATLDFGTQAAGSEIEDNVAVSASDNTTTRVMVLYHDGTDLYVTFIEGAASAVINLIACIRRSS